jgi:hypothetical protein
VTLEAEFDQAMWRLYEAMKEADYRANYFRQRLDRDGGLETARYLIGKSKPSSTFARWLERDRLDLTVEVLVIEPKWHPLFSEDELARARSRLLEHGWTGSARK